MPATRVIPVHNPRGLYAAIAALGIILGPIAGLLVLNTLFLRRLTTHPILEVVEVFIIPAIFIAAFATRCQRARPVFLTAFTFGFSYWLSFIIAQQLAQRDNSGSSLLTSIWVGFLFAASLIALITALAALLLRWLIRWLLVIYVEQTGLLCTHCAYPTNPALQTLCPECGKPLDPPPARDPFLTRFFRSVRRAGRAALALVLIAFIAVAAATIARRGYGIHRFHRAVTGGEQVRPAGFIDGAAPDGTPIQRLTTGAWLPFPGDIVNGVIVAYLPDDEPGLPAAQLSVTTRPTPNTFMAVSPVITCSLNRAQAEAILRDGVPPSLLAAMRDASPGPAVIDPAPHFPR